MKLPPRWALEHLFPLLGEVLAPLLPVDFKISSEKSDWPLRYSGEEVAYLHVNSSLTEEEYKRWQPLMLAHFEQTLAFLIRDYLIKGFPGPEVLKRVLKTKPLTGLLLKVSSTSFLPEKAYAISTRIFFIPVQELKPKTFLKNLWQKGTNFLAISCSLSSPDDIKQALNTLSLAENFGFSWLTERGEKYFPVSFFLEQQKVLNQFLRCSGKYTLVWAKGPKPSLNCLTKKARRVFPMADDEAILAFSENLEEIKYLLSSLSLKAGVRPPGKTKYPLKEVWAAFEHAKRLSSDEPVVFSPYSLHVLGDVLLDMGDLFGALACYHAAKEKTPQPVELLNSMAYIFLELKNFIEAEKALKQAIAISPEDPMLHYNLGLFFEKIAKNPLPAFEKAYSLAPKDAIFAESLAASLARENSWDRIRNILEGLSLSKRGRLLLARAYYELGELDKAFEIFRALANEEPQNLEVLAYLALLYIQLKGDFGVAEAVLPQLEEHHELKKLAENIRFFMES
ncbi:tetratricopeptide repeat protein [Thermodesulfatator autotrophicus]|uniref:Tetratricopeptide repeat protein n=1 Tax=Thermodesulfatator autotrophicus TaxID=1795632 RepID=A0A177E7Y4_9BACT|nr:tetratricopeptide repeat protein [Thermodesulfatator autotrophicus]OAG28005.1 hypothetical protein TH606_03995 [Thermodesulfatator autotrophicus]